MTAAPARQLPRAAALPPSPESLCLPARYRQQARNYTLDQNRDDDGYWKAWRIDDSWKYQLHVYRLAASLIKARGVRSVLDVGCGAGTKLGDVIAPLGVRITGVDQPSGIALARRRVAGADLFAADLESDGWADRIGSAPGLVICADVLEHLLDPRPLLRAVARCAPGAIVVLSTPERRRLRGRGCDRATKPEHVREWSRAEFVRFVTAQGFRVEASILYPQDDAPVGPARVRDMLWRVRLRRSSKLACHAVVCRSVSGLG